MHKLILFITAICVSFHPHLLKKCIIIKEKKAKTNRVKESLIWVTSYPEGKIDIVSYIVAKLKELRTQQMTQAPSQLDTS